MSKDDLLGARREKLKQLQSVGINPFPNFGKRSHYIKNVKKSFDQLNEEETLTIVGRIRSWRGHGGSTFAELQDESDRIQLYFKKDDLGEVPYNRLDLLDLGDFLQIEGKPFVTKKGEQSLWVTSYTLLSKSLRPLPNDWYGLKDKETRYRKRYLDFIINPDQKDKIVTRAKLMQEIRTFLYQEGFMELEYPMLEVDASGANAKPFVTHINAYDMSLYLRICAGELWQKRALVGGFEKVFEMGRAFRNEGVDFSHNPEFTMLEYYWAYASLEENMQMHERLFSQLAKKVLGSFELNFREKKIDLTPPYPRLTFREAILQQSGVDIEDYSNKESLKKLLTKHQVDIDPSASYARLLDDFYKHTARPNLIQPMFITEYPVELIPLAKRVNERPQYSDMFQLLIAGMEVSKSFNELNDPIDQKERFMEQAEFAAEGDEEAMQFDHEYVEALEYGMPPATGTGIGIDRLSILFTNSDHLREVIAFPLMRPIVKQQVSVQKEANEKEDEQPEEQAEMLALDIPYTKAEAQPITREEALQLLKEFKLTPNTTNHSKAVEAAVRFYARTFGADEEMWAVAGLLHDADWDSFPEEHPKRILAALKERQVHPEILQAIACHGLSFGRPLVSQLDKVLFACDELTGLITAATLVRPDQKLANIELKSIKKKFKDRGFAKGVNREDIRLGAEMLGISLDEHMQNVLDAMKEVAEELGL